VVYGVYTMKRKQIYIAPDQEEQLKLLAEQRSLPVSHLIREALAVYIAEQEAPRLGRPEDNPLWGIVGLVDDPDAPIDASTNLDHYLYGASKRTG
jgi:predicted hydrolase (HD superfamily)